MNRFVPLVAVTALCSLITATGSMASPGDLDLGFGGFGLGGKIQDLGFDARASLIDAQGRLVLVGSRGNKFYVQRRSGPRFLTVEERTLIFDEAETSAVARAVAIAANGKIAVGGEVTVSGRKADFAIARLNPDLTPDPTFAEDGLQSSNFHGLADRVLGVDVQGDGKIIVVGEADTEDFAGFSHSQWGVERFRDDGNLDEAFDGDGKWTFGEEELGVAAKAVVVLADGRILIAGTICTGLLCDNDFGLVRLSPTGTLDGTFGDGGIVDTGFGGEEDLIGLAVAPDGKIAAVGRRDGSPDTTALFLLARYMSNGSNDLGFADHGRVVLPLGTEMPFSATAIAIQPDGKIVVSGQHVIDEQPGQFALARFNGDGTFDATFGDDGMVFTTFDTIQAGARTVASQIDGTLVAVGGAQAARYRWDGSLDAGGIVDVIFNPLHITSTATALVEQADGKLLAAGHVYYHPDPVGGGTFDMALARFTRDRHGLDPTFGTESPPMGRTLHGLVDEDENVYGLALRDDGKAVVTGSTSTDVRGVGSLVGRFNADGTADASCNGIGFTDLVIGTIDGTGRTSDTGTAVAPAPDNKIYAGVAARGLLDSDFGLGRLKEDCSVDVADGVQLRDYKFAFDLGGDDDLSGILLQGANIVLAGTSGPDIVLTRVGFNLRTMSVSTDSTFGMDGKASLITGFDTRVVGLGQQSDGKLIVGGWLNRGAGTRLDADFFVVRFTADGALDMTFGDGGIALADFGPFDAAYGVAVRSDDTIALAGCTSPGSEPVAVAQFTATGQLDRHFSGDGKATLRLGPDGSDCARAVTFLGFNSLVVGGYSNVFGKPQFALASFETTVAGPISVPCAGDCDGDGSVTVDEVVTLVNIALGLVDGSTCEAGDANQDGQVTVDEIVTAVNTALVGCPIT